MEQCQPGNQQHRKKTFVRQPLPTIQKFDTEFLENSIAGLIVHALRFDAIVYTTTSFALNQNPPELAQNGCNRTLPPFTMEAARDIGFELADLFMTDFA